MTSYTPFPQYAFMAWCSVKSTETTASTPLLGFNQPPIQWISGAFSAGVKLTIYLHLEPRVRMSGAILPLPLYVFMAKYLVKHRDKFTFMLISCTIPVRV
jgi:hypothetical protein